MVTPLCREGFSHAALKLDDAAWRAMPSDGIQDVIAGPDPIAEPAFKLDLRRCACGSTISRVLMVTT